MTFWAVMIVGAEFFFSPQLRGGLHGGCCRSAEEPHQSLDVLRHRCQEELLPHELQSAEAQAAQPDLILEFRQSARTTSQTASTLETVRAGSSRRWSDAGSPDRNPSP